MSSYNGYKRYLDNLYFNMLEYFTFEKEFTSNLPKNYISSHVICLVDAEEIENWKATNAYDSCVDFLENCDNVNFEKFQVELLNQNQYVKSNLRKFETYETLDEVCHTLKKGGRISVVGNQFLCYVNKITYTKKCFKCYTKNNQLIIYFGGGKSIFIPKFYLNKVLDSENVYIVDLPGDKNCFVEAIFDKKNKYPNMYESIKSCGNNLKLSMTNLLSYDVDKNELKKFKTYNFYINEEEKNSGNDDKNMNINVNIYQQGNNGDINNGNLNLNYENYNLNNDNDIIYNYNNNYYINYVDDGKNPNIEPNYTYSNNVPQYYGEKVQNNEIINNNININEYPRDTNENININNLINNNNEINIVNPNYSNNIPEINPEKEANEVKEKKEQNNNIEIGNQNQEEPEKDILRSNKLNKKEEINKSENKYIETESQNQIEQEKETFYLNELNNQETNRKKELEKEKEKEREELNNKEKEKSGHNSYIDSESQNQVDQEKENFYINYIYNQKTNPELKDLEFSQKEINNNNENENNPDKNLEKDFSIKNIKSFPTLGLDNKSGNNSYINSSLQCLINTIPLVNFFLGGKNINKITEEDNGNDNNIKILPSFLQIMKKLWTNDDLNTKSINPEKFINNLKQISSSFNKEEENDIGELILFLIEQIYTELQESDKYKEDNISSIYYTFFGGENELTKECIKCLNDNKENEVQKFVENKDLYYLAFRLNDVLDYLKSNNIKETNNINIYDCLNFYESPKIAEPNGKTCEKCGNKEEFLITSKIKKCQNNLLILLNKNFNQEEDIKFELSEILEMKNFLKENETQEKLTYFLYAIICLNIAFDENKNKIHHVAFCKSPVDSLWYKYDDNIVEPINSSLENEVEKIGMPVALFYQKCE